MNPTCEKCKVFMAYEYKDEEVCGGCELYELERSDLRHAMGVLLIIVVFIAGLIVGSW